MVCGELYGLYENSLGLHEDDGGLQFMIGLYESSLVSRML